RGAAPRYWFCAILVSLQISGGRGAPKEFPGLAPGKRVYGPLRLLDVKPPCSNLAGTFGFPAVFLSATCHVGTPRAQISFLVPVDRSKRMLVTRSVAGLGHTESRRESTAMNARKHERRPLPDGARYSVTAAAQRPAQCLAPAKSWSKPRNTASSPCCGP